MIYGQDEGFSNADWDEYFEGEAKAFQNQERLQEECDEDTLLDLEVNGFDNDD